MMMHDNNSITAHALKGSGIDDTIMKVDTTSMARRDLLQSTGLALGVAMVTGLGFPSRVVAEENMFAPKFVQEYPDFVQSKEGWSYKDVKVGSGESPKAGDRVVYEWSGYTIGYFGRPFEAKGYVRIY